MNLEHISLREKEVWREKEKLNADLEAEEERLLKIILINLVENPML
jgi:hypothetical protein